MASPRSPESKSTGGKRSSASVSPERPTLKASEVDSDQLRAKIAKYTKMLEQKKKLEGQKKNQVSKSASKNE